MKQQMDESVAHFLNIVNGYCGHTSDETFKELTELLDNFGVFHMDKEGEYHEGAFTTWVSAIYWVPMLNDKQYELRYQVHTNCAPEGLQLLYTFSEV